MLEYNNNIIKQLSFIEKIIKSIDISKYIVCNIFKLSIYDLSDIGTVECGKILFSKNITLSTAMKRELIKDHFGVCKNCICEKLSVFLFLIYST